MYSCKGKEIYEAVIVSREYSYLDIIALQHNHLDPETYFDQLDRDLYAVMR